MIKRRKENRENMANNNSVIFSAQMNCNPGPAEAGSNTLYLLL